MLQAPFSAQTSGGLSGRWCRCACSHGQCSAASSVRVCCPKCCQQRVFVSALAFCDAMLRWTPRTDRRTPLWHLQRGFQQWCWTRGLVTAFREASRSALAPASCRCRRRLPRHRIRQVPRCLLQPDAGGCVSLGKCPEMDRRMHSELAMNTWKATDHRLIVLGSGHLWQWCCADDVSLHS